MSERPGMDRRERRLRDRDTYHWAAAAIPWPVVIVSVLALWVVRVNPLAARWAVSARLLARIGRGWRGGFWILAEYRAWTGRQRAAEQ